MPNNPKPLTKMKKLPVRIEPSTSLSADLPTGYGNFLAKLKGQIATAQMKAALSVNRELILLYWHLGKQILEQQEKEGWGTKVIDRLASDLKAAFPEMKGFSPRNLKYMRALAEAYPEKQFVQGALAQITWYHNLTLLDKVKDPVQRRWYIEQTIRYGWSRNVLVHQIESCLYQRQGKTLTNFRKTLPAPQSDLAQQVLKDPYNFEFLGMEQELAERELERKLLDHLREFLLELGVGFAFLGSQYHLEVDNEDYYLDLLFYHTRLHCYVVVELKVGEFKPEYAGKMNFYLAAVDNTLRQEGDHPSIGLILCKSRGKVTVEYSLKDMGKPIGVAAYQLTASLPKALQDTLPSPKKLEEELGEQLPSSGDKS
jgi:predicted nuclease of restriction endonuclease-like (RecB) superfamily